MRRWWRSWPFLVVVGTFVLAVALRIWYVSLPAVPWWDETIYVGMAKHLFSGGSLGYWEVFRPPIMPVLMGVGWLVGLPALAWGKVVGVIASLGVLVFTYLIGERLHKNAGLVAVVVLAFIPTFFRFGGMALSAIPATCLSLLGLWLVLRKRWYWAGLAFGVAFLTRFVLALFGVGVAIGLIVVWLSTGRIRVEWRSWLNRFSLFLLGGFSALIPYLLIHLITIGDPLFPILEASRVFTQYNNWVYDYGNWYYVVEVLKNSVFFLFSLLGLYLFVKWRKWRDAAWMGVLVPLVLLVAYFLNVQHKEIRFFAPMFPMLAVLAGVGVAWLLGRFRRCGDRCLALVLGSIVVVSLVIGWQGLSSEAMPADLQGDKREFYHYFENASRDDDMLVASNPMYMVYTDKPITFVRSWELSQEVMRRYGNRSDFVAVDLCDHPCQEGSECEAYREAFVDRRSSDELVFNGSYTRWDDVVCDLRIWRLNVS
ncbi:glycosyltransferase family 39 protein [Candidatus Woesearchaeota archaeon]|nr:glycosyltransferase family 39 protein [Candidatus Woesearchaeota archaeon]